MSAHGNKKLIYGVGINDADYVVHGRDHLPLGSKLETTYWRCPYYYAWLGILRRCFHRGKRDKYYSSYEGVTISKEWLIFSNFRAWAEDKYFKGYQIDKDLLNTNSDLYSPRTCCYIPSWLNSAIRENAKGRGEYPLGVSLIENRRALGYKNQFMSSCKDLSGKKKYLGYFALPEEAHYKWQEFKVGVITDYLQRYLDEDIVDERVVLSLNSSITNILLNKESNVITTKIYGYGTHA